MSAPAAFQTDGVNFFAETFAKMNQQRELGMLCDVALTCTEDATRATSINAHKTVLAACSPYFWHMFSSGGFVESKQKFIVVRGVDESSLRTLVQFAYTSAIRITLSNVADLIAGADYLQMVEVTRMCVRFLARNMNAENALDTKKLAELYRCPKLVKLADNFIRENFVEVSHSSSFTEMNKNAVVALLSQSNLNSTEEEVFMAAVAWISHDLAARREAMCELLQYVRLPLLSVDFLINKVQAFSACASSFPCVCMIREAINYHMEPEENTPRLPTEILTPRSNNPSEKIYMTGIQRSNCNLRSVYSYFPSSDRLELIALKKERQALYAGVASLNGAIYFTGGWSRPDGVFLSIVTSYRPGKNTFSYAPSLNIGRSGHGCCAHDGKLWVVGGESASHGFLSSCEVFTQGCRKWTVTSNLRSSRTGVAVVSCGEHMYAFGGWDERSFLRSAERYDVQSDTWEAIAPMLEARGSHEAVAVGTRIFILGGSSLGENDKYRPLTSCELYDVTTEQFTRLAPMRVARCRFGVVVVSGRHSRILCMGGCGEFGEIVESVQVFDVASGAWSEGKWLGSRLSDINCVSVRNVTDDAPPPAAAMRPFRLKNRKHKVSCMQSTRV